MSARPASSADGLVEYLRTAGSSPGARPRFRSTTAGRNTEEAEASQERSWRSRVGDASPLLTVAAACFLLGLVLRVTGGTGPVAAFPIWSLFLALGLVATVGAGYSLLSDDEEEEPPVPAGVVDEPEESSRLRAPDLPSPDSEPSAPDRDGSSLSLETARSAHEPSEGELLKSAARRRTDRTVPPTPPPSGGSAPSGESAESMMDEIDRMKSDLRPLRRRSPES